MGWLDPTNYVDVIKKAWHGAEDVAGNANDAYGKAQLADDASRRHIANQFGIHVNDPIANAQRQAAASTAAASTARGTSSPTDNGVSPDVIAFIRSQSPGVSKSDAAKLFKQYTASQKYAGLGAFLQQTGHAQDPATVQAFFAQTVAPYLNQAADQYQTGVNVGDQAMQTALSGSLPAAEKNVLSAYRPLMTAAATKTGAAMKGAAVAGPAFDTLLAQINQAYNQQLANRFYTQQAASAGSSTSGGDAASQLAALGVKL